MCGKEGEEMAEKTFDVRVVLTLTVKADTVRAAELLVEQNLFFVLSPRFPTGKIETVLAWEKGEE